MALSPDVFLDGVDSEKDNFGVISGLELWLKLFDEGYMDTGLDYSGVRQKFENKLLEFKELKVAL